MARKPKPKAGKKKRAEPTPPPREEAIVPEVEVEEGLPESEDVVVDLDGDEAGAEAVLPDGRELDEEVTALVAAAPGPIERVSLLQRYFAEVRNYPVLTPEEVRELSVRYREEGDLEAARKLVSSNLRLVVKIALEYYRHWMDLLDLIQEGNVGLMQAVKKFDPYRGIKLSTYSSFWIRAYILKFLMDNWRLVKIGTTQAQRKLFFNLKKEKDRLESLGYKPGPKMLAKALAVKESEVIEMDQRLSGRDESLGTPVSEDGKQTREMVLSDEGEPVDEVLARDEFSRIVKRKLEIFRQTLADPDREKDAYIFDHRLMAENPITLQEAGEHFGISRERIRQLESRLIRNLKEYLKEELPDFEDYEFILG